MIGLLDIVSDRGYTFGVMCYHMLKCCRMLLIKLIKEKILVLIKLLEPLNVPDSLIHELAEPLKTAGHGFVYYSKKATSKEELVTRSENADIVMIANTPFPKEAVIANPKLKLINVAFTGVDHVSLPESLPDGQENPVKICNASGYANTAVAELTVGLTIDLFRKISAENQAIKTPTKNQEKQLIYKGFELKHKVVGIIGTGHIGLEVAKLFKAFQMTVIATSHSEKEEAKKMDITYMPLKELLKKSDIVTLHVPLTPITKGMIGKEELSLMKTSAVLINCARGPVVDTKALASALNHQTIAGAGIDVFDIEPPLPKDHPLLYSKHTVLTPHIGYFTQEAMISRAKIAFANTIAFLSDVPKNIVK